MAESRLERHLRRVALTGLSIAVASVAGVAVGGWTVDSASAFYLHPTYRSQSPAYARAQPIADNFWQQQAEPSSGFDPGFQTVAATSTATNVAPAYRSASGS